MGALKTIFLITIATTRMIFPGIPGASPGPGQTIDQVKTPAIRSINFDLMCDKKALKTARADLKVPAGLGIGDAVKLQIVPGTTVNASDDEAAPKPPAGFKAMTYWGTGEAIAEGQPKITGADQAPETVTYPNYTTYGQWPGTGPAIEGKEITADSHAPGVYNLSSFCGDTSVEVTPEQDFLAPVELNKFYQQADLEKPIKIEWKAVPNAVGYLLTAYGGNQQASITWTSSAQPNPPTQIEYMPIKEADLKQYLDNKVLLPADTTSVTIPAGVFKGSDSVFLTIVAVGKDRIVEKDDIETQVMVRSTACVPLHSKSDPWSEGK